MIKAAAVADFTPVDRRTAEDQEEASVDELTLTLQENARHPRVDGAHVIAAAVHRRLRRRDRIASRATRARSSSSKNADLIVANDVSDPTIGFDSDQNEVLVIARDGSTTRIAKAPKIVVANRILDLVVERLGQTTAG